jgi:hypothetical protein
MGLGDQIITYFNRPDGIYWQNAMRNFHVNTKGWNDIAQHVTLLPDGMFVTGRDFAKTPASMGSPWNTGAFMVEMLGDFDIGKDKLEGKQRESIMGLARWFDKRGKYIRFHSETTRLKTCPGSGIKKEEFMNEVRGIVPQPPASGGGGNPIPNNKPTLRIGDRGQFVAELQTKLNALNLNVGKADGIFGKVTQDKVIAFQRTRNLVADGIVGAKTWQALEQVVSAPTPKPQNGKLGVVTASALNIRRQPSITAPKVGFYRQGEKITILSEQDSWYLTDRGFISKQYVRLLAE